MSHQALARRYRPRRFSEVSTQEHVSETLRRSVASGRVAHAYLFCGPRGVGKTTLARVLAMALNCAERTEEGEPCGVCESCTRIWGGHTALDVIEIDAASNRGVDDARDLRERAMYAPSEEGRYKVYILDEAHMLTREAWNALLKILEEPPPRVIFIFATTEPQKIQQTASPILSRCQRFDFRRIGVTDIVSRLEEVLATEEMPAPPEALRIIARKADGGMRDALSLLDQVLSLTGGEISQEAVRRVLGLVEEERYLELLDILREGRHGAVFAFVESLLDEGYDLVEFYHGLADVVRVLLRLRLGGGGEPTELREDLKEAFGERAESFPPGDLVRMLALVADLESTGSLRRSAQPRMLLEMLLLRLSLLDRTVDVEDLIRGLGGVPPGSGEGREPGRPSGRAASASGGASAGSVEAAGVGEASGAAGAVETTIERPAEQTAGAPAEDEAEPRAMEEATAVPQEPPRSVPEPPRPDPDPPRSEPATSRSESPETAPAARPGRVPAVTASEAWRRLLDEPAGLPRGLGPFLRAAEVREGGGSQLRIALPPGPALDRMADPLERARLEEALGRHMAIRPTVVVEEASGAGTPAERITQDRVKGDRLRQLVAREPLLRQAVEELDLELLE